MRETVDSCGPSAPCCSVQAESSSASYGSSATDQPRAVPPMLRFAETPRTSVKPPTVRHRKTLLNQKLVVQQVDRRSTKRSSRFAPPKRPPPEGPLSNIRPISPLRPISPIPHPIPTTFRAQKNLLASKRQKVRIFMRTKANAVTSAATASNRQQSNLPKSPPAAPHLTSRYKPACGNHANRSTRSPLPT